MRLSLRPQHGNRLAVHRPCGTGTADRRSLPMKEPEPSDARSVANGAMMDARSTPGVQAVQFIGQREARSQELANGPDDIRRPHVLAADVILVDQQDTGMRP